MVVRATISLEENDTVVAELAGDGVLHIELGSSGNLFIYEDKTPGTFAAFCEVFDVQKNTAPGGEAEDGVTDDTVQPEAKDGLT